MGKTWMGVASVVLGLSAWALLGLCLSVGNTWGGFASGAWVTAISVAVAAIALSIWALVRRDRVRGVLGLVIGFVALLSLGAVTLMIVVQAAIG